MKYLCTIINYYSKIKYVWNLYISYTFQSCYLEESVPAELNIMNWIDWLKSWNRSSKQRKWSDFTSHTAFTTVFVLGNKTWLFWLLKWTVWISFYTNSCGKFLLEFKLWTKQKPTNQKPILLSWLYKERKYSFSKKSMLRFRRKYPYLRKYYVYIIL